MHVNDLLRHRYISCQYVLCLFRERFSLFLGVCFLLVNTVAWAQNFTPQSQFTNIDKGSASAASDPGSLAFLDDRELHFELVWQDEFKTRRAFQGYALVPLGDLALSLGYQPFVWQNVLWHRSQIGFSSKLSSSLGAGLIISEYRRGQEKTELSYDWGLFWEPWKWFNLALSNQHANSVFIDDVRLKSSWRLAFGFRPIQGLDRLSVFGETYWDREKNWSLEEQRWGFDVHVVPGIHLRLAYSPNAERVDMGIHTSLNKANTAFMAGAGGDDRLNHVALKLSGKRRESILVPQQKTESLVLGGNLLPKENSLFFKSENFMSQSLRLHHLVRHKRLKKLRLLLDHIDVGWAQIEELRAAIKALRARDIEVEAQILGGDEKTYLIAAACNRITMDPAGALIIDGHSAEAFYFSEALKKIGIRFESVAVGTHKTAPHVLTHAKASPEETKTRLELLNANQQRLVAVLSDERQLSQEAIEAIFATGLFTGQKAMDFKLIDALSGPLKALVKAPKLQEPYAFEPSVYKGEVWGAKERIALVPIQGLITRFNGQSPLGGQATSAEKLVPILDDLAQNIDIAAVILRLESPGGDVFASEQIWRAARRLAAEKPLFVSMGNVAASGAYYIASAAEHILASPGTITGSIGIFAMRLDIEQLLDTLRIGRQELKTGDLAGWDSLARPWSDSAKARVQDYLEAHYATFLDRVAFGRQLPLARIETLAEGKIYTGQAAFANGLVDSLGGLKDSIALVKEKLGLRDEQEVEIWLPNGYASWMQNVSLLGQALNPQPSLPEAWIKRLELVESQFWAVLPEYFGFSPKSRVVVK
jgi:protease-4